MAASSEKAVELHIRHTVTKPHLLLTFEEVVDSPSSSVTVYSRTFQLSSEHFKVGCVTGTGTVKKHELNSDPILL